ncbi:MAG: hypothetical protein DWQ04_21130 [Chloroflexi bacterium]|nr:MAG: hypothetical protein DWQ04_21130 [Chloroflexota bacterium]
MTYSDTHPAAEKVLNQLLRQAPVWRKLQMLADLNRTAHQLAMEGLREKFPEASETDIRRHLADLLLGPELAEKVYGPLVPQQT